MPRNSPNKKYAVVVFNDDSAMALSEYLLLSDPRSYATERGGIWERVLLSEGGFEAVVGHEPEPKDRATKEHARSLRANPK